jgi:hypothetical protein
MWVFYRFLELNSVLETHYGIQYWKKRFPTLTFLLYPMHDGSWAAWQSMQLHLPTHKAGTFSACLFCLQIVAKAEMEHL